MDSKQVIAVFKDGSISDITDEFNYTLHGWKWSFVELSETVKETTGAVDLRFI